jgi:DNA-binding Lrp family transcriptional regulator
LRLSASATEDDLYSIGTSKGAIGFALVTGDYDAIVQLSGRDFKQIQSRVMKLRRMQGVESTNTMLVLRSTPHLGDRKGRTKGRRR